MDDRQVRETTTEARAGSSPHIVRYILAISLLLILVAFGAILWLW